MEVARGILALLTYSDERQLPNFYAVEPIK